MLRLRQERALRLLRQLRWYLEWPQLRKGRKQKLPSNFKRAQPRLRPALQHPRAQAWDFLSGAKTRGNSVNRSNLVRIWHRWSLLEPRLLHTLRSPGSRAKANVAKNSVERRRRLGRLLVLKASLRQKENEKDSSVATNQLQVALPAPAKISINR